MKVFGCVILGVIGLVAIGIGGRLLAVALFPVRVFDRSLETAQGAVDKTLNADNAIYNYEWFKQTHQDIQAAKAQRDNAAKTVDTFKSEAGPRDKWTFEDKNEYARLSAVQLGLESHLETLIANYNARASMANRNLFENSILPPFIDSLTFITK